MANIGINQNPMMNNLSMLNNAINTAKDQIMQLKNAGHSPDVIKQFLLMRNPNMKRAMDFVNANGGDPKSVALKLFNGELSL